MGTEDNAYFTIYVSQKNDVRTLHIFIINLKQFLSSISAIYSELKKSSYSILNLSKLKIKILIKICVYIKQWINYFINKKTL